MKRALATVFAVLVVFALGCLAAHECVGCKPASGPTDADASGIVEGGVQIATDVCSLIEGIDDNGAIRSICATVEEVAQIIAFVLTLRPADAGPHAMAACQNLPGTTFCATSAERAKGILFLVRARSARFLVDAGAK